MRRFILTGCCVLGGVVFWVFIVASAGIVFWQITFWLHYGTWHACPTRVILGGLRPEDFLGPNPEWIGWRKLVLGACWFFLDVMPLSVTLPLSGVLIGGSMIALAGPELAKLDAEERQKEEANARQKREEARERAEREEQERERERAEREEQEQEDKDKREWGGETGLRKKREWEEREATRRALLLNQAHEGAGRRAEYLRTHPDLKPEVQIAIESQVAIHGMTKEHLLVSFGVPDWSTVEGDCEKLTYKTREPKCYLFKDGTLEKTE